MKLVYALGLVSFSCIWGCSMKHRATSCMHRATSCNVHCPSSAPARSRALKSPSRPIRCPTCAAAKVYVGKQPLAGFEGVAKLLWPAARPLLHLHSFVLLQTDDSDAEAGVWFLDFLPIDPTSPLVAAKLITGGAVPGRTRERQLPRLIHGACMVGNAQAPNPLEAARVFNR